MLKKILIVEDDLTLAKMYRKKFEVSNFEVTQAADGEEGLEMALNSHPDLILLDIMMPKVDGIAMMDQLRKDPWGKNVPIIILTNLDASDEIIQRVIVDQPSYYILKSNSIPEEIIEKANSILK